MFKQMQNKKGLSEVVSYVLIVAMALALSVAVFVWLKGYLPGDKEVCSEDASIIIEDYSCDSTSKTLTIELKNNGFFSLDGVFLRASNFTTNKINNIIPSCAGCILPGRADFSPSMVNQNTTELIISYENYTLLTSIEIQPFVEGKKGFLLCKNIVKSDLDCN